jgi:hypothetical protein
MLNATEIRALGSATENKAGVPSEPTQPDPIARPKQTPTLDRSEF